jgi:hypothetical protein
VLLQARLCERFLTVIDLFLVCDDGNSNNKHFQIWVNNKQRGFSLSQIGRLPSGAQSITFADIGQSSCGTPTTNLLKFFFV